MAPVHVLGVVADGLQQFHLDLQGGVGELPQQLGLRGDLGGHQVENEQVEGPDVLVDGPVLRHDKDILALQSFAGGERGWNLMGMGSASLFEIAGERKKSLGKIEYTI